MEKSRFFIVLIFVTAIPIIISKNVKNSVMDTLAKGVLTEISNDLERGITDEIRKNIKDIGFLTTDISELEFKRFLGHFDFFKGVAVLNKRGERELSVGFELPATDRDKKIIKEALNLGRKKVFLSISNASRIFMNILYPYKKKDTNEWKCIHAIADCTNMMASYTKPVKKPMAIFKYVYDSENAIILPSFSDKGIGIRMIPYVTRNLKMGKIDKAQYFLHRKKITFRRSENIDTFGIHAFIVVPKSFMNHVMLKYRVTTNAMLIIIFFILALVFWGIFRSYSFMENTLAMYKSVIEDAGVAVVVLNIKNMKVINSNRIARNVFYIEAGYDLKYFISKESERTYVNNVLFTTGSLYNYKVGIKAKYNEELTVILSLGVNRMRREATLTFFEESAMVSKQSAVTEIVEKEKPKDDSSVIKDMLDFFSKKRALTKKSEAILQDSKKIIADSQNSKNKPENGIVDKRKSSIDQEEKPRTSKLDFLKMTKIDYSGVVDGLSDIASNILGWKKNGEKDGTQLPNGQRDRPLVIKKVKPKMKVKTEDEAQEKLPNEDKTGPEDTDK